MSQEGRRWQNMAKMALKMRLGSGSGGVLEGSWAFLGRVLELLGALSGARDRGSWSRIGAILWLSSASEDAYR